MKPELQTMIIGAVVLLLIINTTVLFSLVSSKDTGGQAVTPALNTTNVTPQKDPAVTPTQKKVISSPTVSAKATSAPKPGATSKAVTSKTQAATVKSNSTANSSTTGFLKYSNETYLFSIDYPQDWTVEEMDKTLLKTINASRSKKEPGITVVEFYSPAVVRCDQLNKDDCVLVRSEVRIDVEPDRKSKTLEDYYLNEMVRLTEDYPIQVTRKDAQIYVGGRKAYSLEYHTGESQGTDGVSVIKVFVIIGDRVFIITSHSHDPKTGEDDQFLQYSDEFQHMIRSFTYAGNLEVL